MSNQGKILVVDDDEAVLSLIKDAFEGFGDFKMDTARDGKQALSCLNSELNSEPFDLIITDLNMPNMDGFELIAAVGDNGFKLPIVVTSGHQSHIVKAKDLDVDGFFEKPFHLASMLQHVEDLLIINAVDDRIRGVEPNPNEANKKILVVDDEVDLAEIICEELKLVGYDTLQAASGMEALSILDSEHVDLILSDIRMPNGSGPDLLQGLVNRRKAIPILFMTGYSEYSFDQLKDLGALACFTKPLNMSKILAQIHDILPS